MSVRDTDDRQVWTVRRRWLPWRPPHLTSPHDPSLFADILGRNYLGILLSYLGILVFVLLLVALIAQWFAALAVIPILLVIRLFLPWFIVARRTDRPTESYFGKATTWHAASRLIATVDHEIRQTGTPQSLTPAHHPTPQ